MILLLENKMNRLHDSINNNPKANIEILKGDSDCNAHLDNFLNNNNLYDTYTTIIIHESIYAEEKRENLFSKLESYCKATEKKLVIFSGNNAQASLCDDILRLSPQILYKYLKFYIKEEELLVLAYGENASLNILLNTLELINLYVQKDEDNTLFDDFEDDVNLLKLKDILDTNEYNQFFHSMEGYEEHIDKNQISILANNLKKFIQENAHA